MTAEHTKGFFHKAFENLAKLLSCGCCREHGTKVANGTDRSPRGEWRAEFSEEVYKEEKAVEGKVARSSERKKKRGSGRSEKTTMGKGEFELARRMKELEMMMDGGDVERVLDVEEALHYYSRLKCPVFVEIVDRFFMDMYNDFSTPPHPSQQLQQQRPTAPSKCCASSWPRLGSISC